MQDVATILEIIASISSSLALDEILARVTEKTAQVVGADSCAISWWDQANNTVVVLADYIAPEIVIPEDDIDDLGVAYSLADYPATARILREQQPVIIYLDDPKADQTELALLKSFQWEGVLLTPMLYKGQAIGLMELYTDDKEAYRFTPAIVTLCQALANQAAVAIQNAQFVAKLETQQERLHRLSLRLLNAQEEERRRLSRELHDELGQMLTALRIYLDRAEQMLPAAAPAKLGQAIAEARQLAGQTQKRARELSLALHPAMLDDLGLVSALRSELNSYRQRTDQATQFEVNLDEARGLTPELEIAIYRIVCEALTNITRHASASRVRVQLRSSAQVIEVSIEDNGCGFDIESWFNSPFEPKSLGLIGMRERAQLLGGQLQIDSEVGRGTQILARFPR